MEESNYGRFIYEENSYINIDVSISNQTKTLFENNNNNNNNNNNVMNFIVFFLNLKKKQTQDIIIQISL